VMVAEIGTQGLDPVALALGLSSGRARLFERSPGGLCVGPRRRHGQRVAEVVHRHAPIGDCAGGVLLQDALECPARVDDPIRMQHGDAALELGLHLRIAGGGETQLAELLVLLADDALVAQLNATIADLRQDRDHWRAEAADWKAPAPRLLPAPTLTPAPAGAPAATPPAGPWRRAWRWMRATG